MKTQHVLALILACGVFAPSATLHARPQAPFPIPLAQQVPQAPKGSDDDEREMMLQMIKEQKELIELLKSKVEKLQAENQALTTENQQLKTENETLKKGSKT